MFTEVLYKSDYLLITYDKGGNFLYFKWLPKVTELTESEFTNEMLHFLEAVDKTGAKSLIIDALEGIFPMTESLNNWILENVTKGFIEREVKKIAYLYPKDYISKLGLEMFISQASMATMSKIERKFFSDVNEAVNWVKE